MAPTPIEANKEEVKAFCVSQKRVTQHVPWRAEQGTSLRSCGGGLGVGGAARNMQLLLSSGLYLYLYLCLYLCLYFFCICICSRVACGGGGAARNMQLLVSSGLLERPHCALTVPHPSQLSHIHHQRAGANVTER